MAYIFDSMDVTYRRPFGAVAEGTAILFRLRVPRALGCRLALLRVAQYQRPETVCSLFWAGETGDGDEWWECHYQPSFKGLCWYDFCLHTDHGVRYVNYQPGGVGVLSDRAGKRWQITCYSPDFKTPDWLTGGVMYQIFPDRFCRSGRRKRGVPTDRVMHKKWDEMPEYRPDEKGEVRNNDFFGGDLDGIRRSLKYLRGLGVTCLYLNPIFESHSNHRYDTANYRHIDPLLGDEDDFRRLAAEAKKHGIRLMLDGVFSHTGSDSVYFNQQKRYDSVGAANAPDSPYSSWYKFRHWPDEYASWWGFKTLPELNKDDPSYVDYITGEDGVAVHWLRAGASAWRLDVADELPDSFLDALRRTVKEEDPDAMILGEVWEDASNKISYNVRRRYLLGDQLDSVMNYPFREAILDFLRKGDGDAFFRKVLTIVENYPPQVVRILMNMISTHDTARALTTLGGEEPAGRGREWQSQQKLSAEQREKARRLLKLAGALQYCLPGVPCLYYGDEVGMEGYSDPFNRGTFPWGKEDKELVAWFTLLGKVRRENAVLREGGIRRITAENDILCFVREDANGCLLCAVNRSDEEQAVSLPTPYRSLRHAAGDGEILGTTLRLPPYSCLIATEQK